MSKRVLIADNSCPFLIDLKKFLEAEGFDVDTAVDSVAVRKCLEQQQFSVVIINMSLDDHTDGQDLSGVLIAKTISARIPIIISTSKPSVEAVRAAFGANFYRSAVVVDFLYVKEGLYVFLEAVRRVADGESPILSLSA